VSDSLPPRKWLSHWLRDEAFWKGVASRTLSGLIVAFAFAAVAAAAGLLDWQLVWFGFVVLLFSLVIPMAAFYFSFGLFIRWERRLPQPKSKVGEFAIALTAVVFVLPVVAIVAWMCFSLLNLWFPIGEIPLGG